MCSMNASFVLKLKTIFIFHFLELNVEEVKNMDPTKLRSIRETDFHNSLKRIRRSVAPNSLAAYEKWLQDFGDVTL